MNMNKKALLAQTLTFLIFIGAFFVINLLTPDRGFSEQENRQLQTRPEFSVSSLLSGSYPAKFEDYITDQFPFRDGWITLKARTELASGKMSNNGVYICEGEKLIEGYTSPEREELDFSLDGVARLCENTDAEVYFALIPSASEIYRDLLPEGAPNDSQADVISYAYESTPAKSIDIASALEQHSGEDIFYRTDHHWTTLGAYYGYRAIAEAMGMEPVPLGSYTPETVTDSFYGTVYSSSGFTWVAPDSITRYVTGEGITITNYPHGSAEKGVLYDESFLEKKDKYSYFYGGNTPLLEIETGNDGPRLLILRDSYTDSMSPFLFEHFSEISILDLRYYKTSLKAYMDEMDFDKVLVCYSVPNFSTDLNIFLMGL